MNLEYIKKKTQQIIDLDGDDENQHIKEDILYTALIRSIAEGRCENIIECCKEVLKTENIKFCRWYA